MSIVIETFTRKPFEIEAIRVTNRNMDEVAEWCGGQIETTAAGKRYIRAEVKNPVNEKQTRAFAGDWVLKVEARDSIKIYTNKAFVNCFDKGTLAQNYKPNKEWTEDMLPLAPAEPVVVMPKGYPEPSTR